MSLDSDRIKKSLKKILGDDRVKTSIDWRVIYSYDATPAGTGTIPCAVTFPETPEEVSEIIKFANKNKIPVYPRGAGTGLTGGSTPLNEGIVISTEKMNRILNIDEDNLTALVEAGVITFNLQKSVEKLGLFYPPDPSSYKYSTIGGNIAENAGGPRCVKYGVTKDYVLELEVIFADGTISTVGSKAIKSVAGYNLKDLIVGSEGTLALITKAYLKLLPKPESTKTMMAYFTSIEDATKAVSSFFKNKVIPTAIEFLDKNSILAIKEHANMYLPDNIESILIIEVDGYESTIEIEMKKIVDVCNKNNATEINIASTEAERESIWEARRAVSPAIAKLKPKKINEDVVVPRSKIPELVKGIYEIADNYGLMVVNFGHAGDGNIHVNFMYDEGEENKVEKAVRDTFMLAIKLEGSISGEHGIGWMKSRFLPYEAKTSLEKMKLIKKALDPFNIMNPGKIFLEI